MIEVLFIAFCAVAAYAGSKFVIWVARFTLPVPKGSFLLLRFLFWWTLSLGLGSGIYFFIVVVPIVLQATPDGRLLGMQSSMLPFGGIILQIPYWVGFFKGIDLQLSQGGAH